MKQRWLILIVALITFAPALAWATERDATTCSPTDVQSAITAAQDGDVVKLPACSITWSTSGVTASGKNITIEGSGEDITNITVQLGGSAAFDFGVDASHFITFKDMTLNGGSPAYVWGLVTIGSGSCCQKRQVGFRITNVKVTGSPTRTFTIFGDEWGLIDHVDVNVSTSGNAVTVLGDGFNSWAYPQSFGDANAVYVEDSTFTFAGIGDGVMDTYQGARYVFRHNSVTNTVIGNHGMDSGNYRSSMTFEVYDNTWTNNTGTKQDVLVTRGGAGLFYNNTIGGTVGYGTGVDMKYYRSACDVGALCSDWGLADGTQYKLLNTDLTRTCTSGPTCTIQFEATHPDTTCTTGDPDCTRFLDGDIAAWSGGPGVYPGRDQPGVTHDQVVIGDYAWNNTAGHGIGTCGDGCFPGQSTTHPAVEDFVQLGRDYFNQAPGPGLPLTSYTPYTYPHPLQGGGGGGGGPNTVYVDNGIACADDVSHGSEASPFCTLGYAETQIAACDTIFVKTGTYNEVPIFNGPFGTSDCYTYIKAFPGASPVLLGNGNTGRVRFNSVQYLVFDGFEIRNYNHCLYLDNVDHVTISNNNIHDCGQELVHISNNSTYVTLSNDHIHDSSDALGGSANGECLYIGTGSGGPTDDTHDITASYLTLDHCRDEAVDIKPGTYHVTLDHLLIYNATYRSDWSPTYGAIECSQSLLGAQQNQITNPGHVIKNSIIHDSKTAIRLGTGCSSINNVIYNYGIGNYGIYIDNISTDGVGTHAPDAYLRIIYHTTIDGPSSSAVVIDGTYSVSTDIRNNIGPTTTNNLATNAAYYVDQASANYQLVKGSAPIDAGVDLTSMVGTDILGIVRPVGVAPDLGAYEYVGTGAAVHFSTVKHPTVKRSTVKRVK